MNSCEWSIFLNTLAISIARGKTADELAFLSLLCSQLSTSFALLSTSPPGCNRGNASVETDPAAEADAILSTGV